MRFSKLSNETWSGVTESNRSLLTRALSLSYPPDENAKALETLAPGFLLYKTMNFLGKPLNYAFIADASSCIN